MLINFCDSRLFPKISCDKVSVDGHEVENLISENVSQKQRGFLGESFIKPPVTITLSFSCNVEISRVLINPCVGAQKSTGLELYSRSNCVRFGPLWENVPRVQAKAKNDYELIVSAVYTPIGKVQLSEASTVCFENRLFRPLTPGNNEQSLEVRNARCVELKGRNPRALNFVSDLNIRITRTASGRSVAIKSIEVWGQPSLSIPATVREKIHHLFSGGIQNQSNGAEKSQEESTINKQCQIEAVHETRHLENRVVVPEDFTDAITCEIMTMPMLLPCGKNVDQETLERHNCVEASWGRVPSDPFTGVAYDNKNKPLPNVHLKVRIDKFLLENSDKFRHIPKTLGSKSEHSSSDYNKTKVRTSCLVGTAECSITSENQSDEEQESNRKRKTQVKRKRKISSNSEIEGVQCSENQITSNNSTSMSEKIMSDKSKKDEFREKIIKEKKSKADSVQLLKSKTHEEKLKESIDSAYSDILSQLPSFIKANSSASSATPVVGSSSPRCCDCGEQGGGLYSAPCGHVFCRGCVMDKTPRRGSSVFDKKCQRTWTSNEIYKVHK